MIITKQHMKAFERDLLCETFEQFQDFAQKYKGRYPYLEIQLLASGAGSINEAGEPGCNEWLAWDSLLDAPGKIREAIEKWEREIEEEG